MTEKFRCDPLGGGVKHFLCSPLPGEMIQFDEHIFQMGWFNHQLIVLFLCYMIGVSSTNTVPEMKWGRNITI